MNVKKYLHKKAEEDDAKLLTEGDEKFCRQLADYVREHPAVPQNKKPKIKLWASIGSAVAAVLLAVIIIPFALIKKPNNEVLYQEGNVASIVCSVDDLNNGSSSFELIQSQDSKITVKQFFDTVSNDALYYEVKVTGVISEYSLYVVVNEKYNYKFDLNDDLLIASLTEYSLNYYSVSSGGSEIEVQYQGVITLNSETVYIDYGQFIDLGEQVFFEDIQNVLKAKN